MKKETARYTISEILEDLSAEVARLKCRLAVLEGTSTIDSIQANNLYTILGDRVSELIAEQGLGKISKDDYKECCQICWQFVNDHFGVNNYHKIMSSQYKEVMDLILNLEVFFSAKESN